MDDRKIRVILERDLARYELAGEEAAEAAHESHDSPQVDARAGSIESWRGSPSGLRRLAKKSPARSTSELKQLFAKREL